MERNNAADEASGIRTAPHQEVPPDGASTRTETAYAALRTDIIKGARAARERLRIDRLSQIYGIGPTPLREALQRLCADRLVLFSKNRGFAVAPLDIQEFRDLNIARTSIEKEALRLSLARGDNEWEAGVVAAAYRLAKEDAALRHDDAATVENWERANTAFHLATVSACGSSWLLQVRRSLHDQCERYRHVSIDLKRGTRDLNAEHEAIKTAVLERNSEKACALVAAHFERTAELLAAEMVSDTDASR